MPNKSNCQLRSLVKASDLIGHTCSIDFEKVLVLTNDFQKAKVGTISENAFLIASNLDSPHDPQIILLRTRKVAPLPFQQESLLTKIHHLQELTSSGAKEEVVFDPLTQNRLQFGALECCILGTFYEQNEQLQFGSDLESFMVAQCLKVYRPTAEQLQNLINFVPPQRRRVILEESQDLRIPQIIPPIRLGTIRYASTRANAGAEVVVNFELSDLLAKRIMTVGCTRFGKSNFNKILVKGAKQAADAFKIPLSFLLLDLNGEYANENEQDKGSLGGVFPASTVRYSLNPKPGFRQLNQNFYYQWDQGLAILRQLLRENRSDSQPDVAVLLNSSFEEPDSNDHGLVKRFQLRVAAYQTLLYVAGFEPPPNLIVTFHASQEVQDEVHAAAGRKLKDPLQGLTLDESVEWIMYARSANRESTLMSSNGSKKNRKPWLDADTGSILNLIAGRNSNDAYINGSKLLSPARAYHSPVRTSELGDEIYGLLNENKIVIVDLSLGDAAVKKRICDQLARHILHRSLEFFTKGRKLPFIHIFVEECHNLLPKNMCLTDAWPRLAKEGGKLNISLGLGTQSPSALHHDILAQSENIACFCLNCEDEVKEITKFYDFADFAKSLNKADSGFCRIKTASKTFVIPVQIDLFRPALETTPREISQEHNQTSEQPATLNA